MQPGVFYSSCLAFSRCPQLGKTHFQMWVPLVSRGILCTTLGLSNQQGPRGPWTLRRHGKKHGEQDWLHKALLCIALSIWEFVSGDTGVSWPWVKVLDRSPIPTRPPWDSTWLYGWLGFGRGPRLSWRGDQLQTHSGCRSSPPGQGKSDQGKAGSAILFPGEGQGREPWQDGWPLSPPNAGSRTLRWSRASNLSLRAPGLPTD